MIDSGREQLLRFPARHLHGLPFRTRFILEHIGMNRKITFASFEISAPDGESNVVFDGLELRALVAGVEAGRVWPSDFDTWVRRKLEDPQFRVTPAEALGDVRVREGRASSLGAVLSHLGLQLASVHLGSVAHAATQPAGQPVEQAA